MNEQIVDCPKCGEPYRIYTHTVADQSLCPGCTAARLERLRKREERDGRPGEHT